ncbi:hypothetical protein KBZ12_10355 [Cyanobium sp. Cruz CV13-4-11]|uniref:hypothetical protein n=1 Tax=Cyanobium sp. Cruz CV11-17 TaxID=2823709 RepID=UPI0020CE9AE8|nr:hypothetical protein [Cyanobium sp. Cruz CV11-17]MCP9919875.1 hypothetical protein [Cyanobium sp. Cruz CV13-4-11]
MLDLASGHFIDCNRSAHERLGYAREHFLTLNPAAIQADGELADDLMRDQLRTMRCGNSPGAASPHATGPAPVPAGMCP